MNQIWSYIPEATRTLSLDIAQQLTYRECPLSVARHAPSLLHILICRSKLADRSHVPLLLYLTQVTADVWPLRELKLSMVTAWGRCSCLGAMWDTTDHSFISWLFPHVARVYVLSKGSSSTIQFCLYLSLSRQQPKLNNLQVVLDTCRRVVVHNVTSLFVYTYHQSL